MDKSKFEEIFIAFWNFNWGTGQPKDQKLINHILEVYPDIQLVAGVETKVDNFSQMFPKVGWRIVQSLKNLSGKNVSLAIRKLALHNPKVRGLKVGVPNKGYKLLPRPLRILDVYLWDSKRNRWQRCRIIIGHRPPMRFKILDPFFDASVKFRIKCRSWGRKGFWALLEDFNEDGHSVAKKFGGTFYGFGIDGCVCGPGMTMTTPIIDRVPKNEGWTDHVGVVGKLRLK